MQRAIVAVALAVPASGMVLFACDLFHSTNFATLCDVTPTADACADVAQPTVTSSSSQPTNFCAWDAFAANKNAEHACTWLSACESPLGHNDFGLCMVAALLAYDCAANPDLPVLGPLHDYWDALWRVQNCADVDRAVFPGAGAGDKVPVCANAGFASCGQAYDGGDNSAVRVECDEAGAPAHGESCLAQGQTCESGVCVGVAKAACAGNGCVGTALQECNEAGVDLGTDCALIGSGSCVMNDAGPACAGTGTTVCAPTSQVTCTAGVARGCPAGTVVTIDCNVLAGDASCSEEPRSGADISAACTQVATSCGPDRCANADTLVSCGRGRLFTTSCSSAGLRACALVATVDGTRAACKRP